jgi:hypothetical protein
MKFVHEDPDFPDLVRIVASNIGLSLGLVEKDYWVTHTLWALADAGLEVWFKGGTSLSKGFGLIRRFSEDIDVMIGPGTADGLESPSDWNRGSARATADRRRFFEGLSERIVVPGAVVRRYEDDLTWRAANFRVQYPGAFLESLDAAMSRFVRLEVGGARVTPSIERNLSSFLHDHLAATSMVGEYFDNRPRRVPCLHPIVTLLEKLDAINRRFHRSETAAAAFVRHYEDAARIIAAETSLPAIEGFDSVRTLAEDMLAQRQIRAIPSATDKALLPDGSDRWTEVERAHDAISAMFWGERLRLADACTGISTWIRSRF